MVIALAKGIIKKITVSKKTGIPRKKLLIKKPMGAFSLPVNFSINRIIRSAAPLSSIDLPIMAAMAIRMPILVQVLPNSVAIFSPILLWDNFTASAAELPFNIKKCSIEMAGVSKATTKA